MLDYGAFEPGLALQSLCGFGAVAAAARTAHLVATLRPSHVYLAGIAGAYDTDAHPIGTALAFARVAIEGIGVGDLRGFSGPPALGFPQWPGSDGTSAEPIGDELELAAGDDAAALLLTTCAASADREQADLRRRRFPAAVAEDMEGFGVALACALARVPVTIVRGISNRVGERDPKTWRIPAALAAARRRVLAELGRRGAAAS